jgi:hypothetical protein
LAIDLATAFAPVRAVALVDLADVAGDAGFKEGLLDLAATATFLAGLEGAFPQATGAAIKPTKANAMAKTNLADRLDKTLALNTGTTSADFAGV